MKKILILLFVISTSLIFSQKIESFSPKTSLKIKFGPPDHIPPIVHCTKPVKNVIDSLPIYTQDSVIVFEGDWTDNVDDILYVTINDSLTFSFNSNNYKFTLNIPIGVSSYNISFEDFKKNSFKNSYVVERNDTIDITPPEIIVTEPRRNSRGFDIVRINQTDSLTNKFVVRGLVIENSGINSFFINDIPISLDSNLVFNWVPDKIPEFINIKAIDNYGNVATKNINLKSKKEITPADLVVGNYYALIIGIQNYNDPNIPSLDFPIKDANDLKTVLLGKYAFTENNIEVMKDPSRKEIIKKLKDLRMKLSKQDNLLIFYAGHGYWDEDLQQGFWLPSDASLDDDAEWLSNGRVRDYIRGINTKHTLLIADACFSGGIFKSREVSLAAPKSIQEMYNSTSRRAMTSGTLNEVPDKSVFIEYLIKRLMENSKEFLSSEELFYSLKEAVINNSPVAQTPEYGVIHQAGDEGGGSFIFIKKKNK